MRIRSKIKSKRNQDWKQRGEEEGKGRLLCLFPLLFQRSPHVSSQDGTLAKSQLTSCNLTTASVFTCIVP